MVNLISTSPPFISLPCQENFLVSISFNFPCSRRTLSDLTVMPFLPRRYLIASLIDSATFLPSTGMMRKETPPSGEVASIPSPSCLVCHLSEISMVAIGSSAGTFCVAENAGVIRIAHRNAVNFHMAAFRSLSFEGQIASGRMGQLTAEILQRQRCNIGFKLVCL